MAQADEATRETYLATNCAALLVERERLRKQYAQLTPQAEATVG